MTEEQIGRLEEWASGLLRTQHAYGDGEQVVRLLEERKRLLEGAKYLVENYPERQATRYMLAVKAAIAYAEKAAP